MPDNVSMLRGVVLRALATVCVVALFAWPACAVAQTPELLSTEALDPEIDVQFWVDADRGTGFLLVVSAWAEDLELPATVRMPLPEGAELDWVGEITGLGVESDIPREFLVVDGDGGSAIELTLETTRTAQYEARYLPTEVDGDRRAAILAWDQSSPASRVLFSVRMPAGAEDISIEPLPVGEPMSNRRGETLYALTPQEIATGESLEVRVDYRQGSLLDAGTSDTTVTTTVVIIGVAISILVLALGIILRRQGGTAPAVVEDTAEDE